MGLTGLAALPLLTSSSCVTLGSHGPAGTDADLGSHWPACDSIYSD